MKSIIIILTALSLAGCFDSQQKSANERGRLELLAEADEDLREVNEKMLADSIYVQKSQIDIKDSSYILSGSFTEDLADIRKNVKRINSIQKWTSVLKQHDLLQSSEGVQASYYYSDERLEKIIIRQFGEMSQQLTEYYLLNEDLSFVYDKTYKYNRPIYWDSTAMIENNDSQIFDLEKSEIMERRSYFLGNELVQQLGSNLGSYTINKENLGEEQARIQSDFKNLITQKK